MNTGAFLSPEEKAKKYVLAPEISSSDSFINTDGKPITIAGLKGKVILLDIWTYSCINCQITLPYINDWYDKYEHQGLEIVGLHTPEFAFEHEQSNVEKAVKKFKIRYPVILDNDYSTWQSLGNGYWPRKYLIDVDGYIVYDHIGEGGYEDTEREIQRALQERSERLVLGSVITPDLSDPKDAQTVMSNRVVSAETYFGSARNQVFGNGTLENPEKKILSCHRRLLKYAIF